MEPGGHFSAQLVMPRERLRRKKLMERSMKQWTVQSQWFRSGIVTELHRVNCELSKLLKRCDIYAMQLQ